MTRPLLPVLVAAAVALTAAQAAAYRPPLYGGVVTTTLPDQPLTLDPARGTRESELQLVALLFDTLYRLDERGRPLPHLVAFHDRSADGRVWRLHLRHGVSLHGGQELLARHAVAALKRVLRGPNAYLLGAVTTIDAPGDDLLEIKLRRRANLPLLLCAPATAVAVQQGNRQVGSGPFRLRSWGAAEIRLSAHHQHFAGRPYVEELRFRIFSRAAAQSTAFQVGQLQLSFHGTSAHGSPPLHPFTAIESKVLTTVLLRIGGARSYLKDPQFRLALLKGIDRQRLRRVAGTGHGQVAAGPVAPELTRRTRIRSVPFDRAEANRMLGRLAQRNAELRQDAAGGKLKLSLLVDASRFEDQAAAGQLVADLDRIGVTTTIDSQPAQEYQARLAAGRFQLALARQALQLPDLKVALAGAFAAAGEPGTAISCLARQRCVPIKTRLFEKQLPALPLVHTSTRVYHESRLGALRITAGGRISYEDLFLTRGSP